MTLRLKILRRAEEDAQSIYDHIKKHSPQGAVNWWSAFEDAATRALDERVEFGAAPESPLVGYTVRQVLFKTRRGRTYRFVFTVVDDELRIVRVRGPGQPSLKADELPPNG